MTMTREAMLALLDRRERGFQDRDPEALAADYAATAVLDSPMSGQVEGKDAIRRAYETFLGGFGELKIEREHIRIDGDQMVVVFKFIGKHTQKMLGVEGTGKRIVFRGVTLYKMAEGKIVYERRIYDFTGFLVRLGVLKARPS